MSNPSWFGRNKYSNKSLSDRFWEKVNKKSDNECWNWLGYVDPHGYGRLSIGKSGNSGKSHRYSWILHFGDIPKGLCVCHKCDNRKCVNPNHLFLGTILDNNLDKVRKGRASGSHMPGEENPASKLKNEDVLKIKGLLLDNTNSVNCISKKFNVSKGTIYNIKQGNSWKNI